MEPTTPAQVAPAPRSHMQILLDDPLAGPGRPASVTDFPVTVDNVGKFIFGRRKMIDHLRINALYSHLTSSVDLPSPFLDTMSTWLSTLKVLMVRCPENFPELSEIDPLEDSTYLTIKAVCEALRVTEESFRKGPKAASEGGGQAPGADAGVLVSP